MEPQNIKSNEPVVTATPEKKGTKGLVIGMAACAMLGLGGIAFGVYEHFSKGSESAASQEGASETDKEENASETENIVVTTPDGAEEELTTPTEENPTDYIYINEWGLKIRLPENLTMISYKFNHNTKSSYADSTSLVLSGAVTASQYTPRDIYVPHFVNLDECSLGAISRQSNKEAGLLGSLVFSDDKYDYYYSGPQVYCSAEGSEQSWEVESSKALQNMLTNADNYSAI